MEAQPATYPVDEYSAWCQAGRGLLLATPGRVHTWKVCRKGSRGQMALEPTGPLLSAVEGSRALLHAHSPCQLLGSGSKPHRDPYPTCWTERSEAVRMNGMCREAEGPCGESRVRGSGLRAGVGGGGTSQAAYGRTGPSQSDLVTCHPNQDVC